MPYSKSERRGRGCDDTPDSRGSTLIESYQKPELLRDVTDNFLENGKLNVNGVLTRDQLGDLVYVMTSVV